MRKLLVVLATITLLSFLAAYIVLQAGTIQAQREGIRAQHADIQQLRDDVRQLEQQAAFKDIQFNKLLDDLKDRENTSEPKRINGYLYDCYKLSNQ